MKYLLAPMVATTEQLLIVAEPRDAAAFNMNAVVQWLYMHCMASQMSSYRQRHAS